jgi:hypothetical protein
MACNDLQAIRSGVDYQKASVFVRKVFLDFFNFVLNTNFGQTFSTLKSTIGYQRI